MQQSGVLPLVKVPDKVKVRMCRHVGGRHPDILIPGDVHPGGIVRLVVLARGDRKGGNRTFPVVHHGVHVRREHREGIVIHGYGRIRPPQEALGIIGRVEQPAPDLDIRLVRIQGHAGIAFGAVDPVGLPDRHRGGPIRVFAEGAVHRHKGGRPVVLRPVELDSPADPRPGQSHQCGLDHPVVVYKVISVRLVQRPLDAAAQFRQDHHIQVIILQDHCPVRGILFDIADFLADRNRVHLSRGALVSALLNKQRVLFHASGTVGGNDDSFLVNPGLVHMVLSPDFYPDQSGTYHIMDIPFRPLSCGMQNDKIWERHKTAYRVSAEPAPEESDRPADRRRNT